MMLCIIHAKHDSEDKQVGYWQFGCPSCMRNKIAALRADNEELRAICRDKPGHDDLDAAAFQVNMLTGALSRAEDRIAELKAALKYVEWRGPNGLCPCCPVYSDPATKTHSPYCQLAAALKGDADDEG